MGSIPDCCAGLACSLRVLEAIQVHIDGFGAAPGALLPSSGQGGTLASGAVKGKVTNCPLWVLCCRDLWHGADLAGGGKKRALWNAALLADGVAPAYVQVGPLSAFHLFPYRIFLCKERDVLCPGLPRLPGCSH